MSKRIVFRSLARPDWAYTAHEGTGSGLWEVYWRCACQCIDSWCGTFQTYGDGLTQHSPESPAAKADMADYLASLAAYLLDHPEDIPVIYRKFGSDIRKRTAIFAATVKYREDKRAYYSIRDEKVSTADSRRYDKRWDEVPSWANGGIDSVWRLCCTNDAHSTLDRYAMALGLQRLAGDDTLPCWCPTDFPIKAIGYEGEGTLLRYAFDACKQLCDSLLEREAGEAALRHYRERVERQATPTEPAACA